MSRKRNQPVSTQPEFRVIVTRPHGRGPLGPYRFVLAVAFALTIAGDRLLGVLRNGEADDGALLAAAAAGLFVWIVTTVINNILASATTPEPATVAVAPDEHSVPVG